MCIIWSLTVSQHAEVLAGALEPKIDLVLVDDTGVCALIIQQVTSQLVTQVEKW